MRANPARRRGRPDKSVPLRLAKQIALLQLIYYLLAVIVLGFSLTVSGEVFSLDWFFSWRLLRSDSALGWTVTLDWLLVSLFNTLSILLIIGRSRLVWDFVLTLHGIHFLLVWIHSGSFPASLWWWSVQAASIAIMVSLGVWATQWRELRTEFFSDQTYEMTPTRQPQPEHETGASGSNRALANGLSNGSGSNSTAQPLVSPTHVGIPSEAVK